MIGTIITPGTASVNDYSSRRVMLEVTSGQGERTRLGTYTLTVSYSDLSQTIQRIHRLGGKVSRVVMTPMAADVPAKVLSHEFLPVSAAIAPDANPLSDRQPVPSGGEVMEDPLPPATQPAQAATPGKRRATQSRTASKPAPQAQPRQGQAKQTQTRSTTSKQTQSKRKPKR